MFNYMCRLWFVNIWKKEKPEKNLTSCLTGRPECCLICAIMQRSEMDAQIKQRGGLSVLKHLVRPVLANDENL